MSDDRARELAVGKAAVAQTIGPEIGAAHLARLLALPAELVVPLVLAATGRRGVALMPALVGQGNAVLAAIVTGVLRRRSRRGPDSVDDDQQPGPMPVWQRAALLSALGYGVVSPIVAARSRWGVLPGRSPLWAYLVQGLLTVPVSLATVTAVLRVSRRARDEHRRSQGTPPGSPGAVSGDH